MDGPDRIRRIAEGLRDRPNYPNTVPNPAFRKSRQEDLEETLPVVRAMGRVLIVIILVAMVAAYLYWAPK